MLPCGISQIPESLYQHPQKEHQGADAVYMEFQAAKARLVKRTPFAIAVAGDEVESEVEVEGGRTTTGLWLRYAL